MAAVCEHGSECHDGTESSAASAPEASRAWLLIEHPGPWPHEAAEAAQPAPLTALVESAEEFGLRVQMIRRPGRRQVGDVRSVFLGWTADPEPFLRRAEVSASAPELAERDLKELAAGIVPSFGEVWDDPVFLVCTHGKRSACCARLGAPQPRLRPRGPAQEDGAHVTHLPAPRPADHLHPQAELLRRRHQRRQRRGLGRPGRLVRPWSRMLDQQPGPGRLRRRGRRGLGAVVAFRAVLANNGHAGQPPITVDHLHGR